MAERLYQAVWRQLGAAIDMLDDAIAACPDALWRQRMWVEKPPHEDFSAAWYVTYHCLFWLDLHLHGGPEGFTPPAPFTLDELDPAGLMPERVYPRAELRAYLADIRARVKARIEGLTETEAERPRPFNWGTPTYAELLLYTMRHVQEHAGQLKMFLGQNGIASGRYVGVAGV